MRKPNLTLQQIKEEITKLKGKPINMHVNNGRKKIVHYEGVVENIYNSVFVVKINNDALVDKKSYSFSEVLCGDVRIALKQ
ncbi:MAG: Veg family protein [Clostridia bacterium]|nr:Veg family protein [Clostridia bacterium]